MAIVQQPPASFMSFRGFARSKIPSEESISLFPSHIGNFSKLVRFFECSAIPLMEELLAFLFFVSSSRGAVNKWFVVAINCRLHGDAKILIGALALLNSAFHARTRYFSRFWQVFYE